MVNIDQGGGGGTQLGMSKSATQKKPKNAKKGKKEQHPQGMLIPNKASHIQ